MASSPNVNPEGLSPQEPDYPLTSLTGLGTNSARKLADIGITRIADLAQMNASALEEQCRGANYDIKHATLAKWIDQARQFMARAATTSSPQVATASDSQALPPASDRETAEQVSAVANEDVPDRWEEVGNFHITAQVYPDTAVPRYRWVIRHLETNVVDVLPDIVGDRLSDWMMPHLSEPTRDLDSTVKTMSPSPMQFIGLKIHQLSNPNSPISVDLPHHTMPPAIDGNLPFTLEINCMLTDEGQRQLLQQNEARLSCEIQAFAKPLSPIRGATIWSDTVVINLDSKHRIYSIKMHSTQLKSGLYVLQILAIIPNIKASPQLLEIPIFKVN